MGGWAVEGAELDDLVGPSFWVGGEVVFGGEPLAEALDYAAVCCVGGEPEGFGE